MYPRFCGTAPGVCQSAEDPSGELGGAWVAHRSEHAYARGGTATDTWRLPSPVQEPVLPLQAVSEPAQSVTTAFSLDPDPSSEAVGWRESG